MSTVQETRFPMFSKMSKFYSTISVQTPMFTRKKLYPGDSNN